MLVASIRLCTHKAWGTRAHKKEGESDIIFPYPDLFRLCMYQQGGQRGDKTEGERVGER